MAAFRNAFWLLQTLSSISPDADIFSRSHLHTCIIIFPPHLIHIHYKHFSPSSHLIQHFSPPNSPHANTSPRLTHLTQTLLPPNSLHADTLARLTRLMQTLLPVQLTLYRHFSPPYSPYTDTSPRLTHPIQTLLPALLTSYRHSSPSNPPHADTYSHPTHLMQTLLPALLTSYRHFSPPSAQPSGPVQAFIWSMMACIATSQVTPKVLETIDE